MSGRKTSEVRQAPVAAADDGMRLDRWFRTHVPEMSFVRLQKACRKGEIRIDGKRCTPAARITAGAHIRIPPLEERPADKEKKTVPRKLSEEDAAFIRAQVIYKDADAIVLNKPAGLPTQGGTGQTGRHVDGLLDALRFDANERPRLVHRLDKDTSGVLLIARTRAAAAHFAAALKARETEKIYWALVVRGPKRDRGKVAMGMEKLPGEKGERMVEAEDGKTSRTLYKVAERAGNRAAWVLLKPLTGRTHQLRLHMAELGCPIVGDGKYGGADAYLSGNVSRKMHLHARMLAIPKPGGGLLTVSASLPPHMAETWAMLGFDPALDENPFEGMTR